MDQHPNYLMWIKNKYIENSHFQTPMMNKFHNSWEEQAFVDDVALIWPPRSYSCTFCKRKFRSAQALGGHMNVHRRDRARLKLSPSSQNEDLSLSSSNQNPNPNPNPNFLSLSNSNNIARREDCVGDEANLSIGLNFMVSKNRSCVFELNEEINNSKRPKTNDLEIPFFLKPCSSERIAQGLDLELRLGDSPKLK